MPKMSFAQQTDGWETLTSNSEEAASGHPGLAAVRTELAEALAAAKRSRNAHQRLRSRRLVEAKRLREAIVRGEEAEKRLRRFLQAVYGPDSPELRRFGLKPRKGRKPERPDSSLVPGFNEEEAVEVSGNETESQPR
jgi:hypothetical protein